MAEAKVKIIENVVFRVINEDGTLDREVEAGNLVVNNGLAMLAGNYNGSVASNAFNYTAVGTGTTAPTATDTALQSESTTGGAQRKSATVTRTTTTKPNDTSKNVATFNITAPITITEAGLFNAASAGTMGARVTFTGQSLVSGQAFEVTWETKFA